MASTGSFRTNSYTYGGTEVGLEFAWYVKSTSIADNTKTIAWNLTGYGNRSSSYSLNSGNFKLLIDGENVYESATRRYVGNGTLVASGEKVIAHNSDGSRSFSVYAEAGIYYVAVNCTGEATFDLDNIPRQAEITFAPDFTDEENPTIKYSNPAGDAVTTIEASIWSGDDTKEYIKGRAINKTGTLEYTFDFAEAERLTLIRYCVGKSMKVKFYLKTTIGGIGYWSAPVEKTMSIVNGEPVITSASVEDVLLESLNATGDSGKVVKGFNEMEASMVAESRKAATIKSYKITNGYTAIGAAMGSFLNAESGVFVFAVEDSRGFITEQTVTLPLIEYVKLTCNMNERPPDAEGNLLFTVEGNAFSGSFGFVDNEVQVYMRYAENGGEFGPWTEVETVLGMNNRYTAEVTMSGLNYKSTYTFQTKAVDLLDDVESPARSVRTFPTFYWNQDKVIFNGATIFKNDVLAVDENGERYSLLERMDDMHTYKTNMYADGQVLVECGSLPNSGSIAVPIPLPENVTEYWIDAGWIRHPNLPNFRYNLPHIDINAWVNSVGLYIDSYKQIILQTTANWSNYLAYVVVGYKY